MPKLSVSLSPAAFRDLGTWVEQHNSNPSVVIEAALRRFGELDERSRAQTIRELMATKKATDRVGWMRLFWEGLADEFGTVDFDSDGRHVTVLRQHRGFDTIWLQLPPSPEHERSVLLQIEESPPRVADVPLLSERRAYTIDYSPFSAAREVAAWICEQQARAQELCRQRITLVPDLKPMLAERAGLTS